MPLEPYRDHQQPKARWTRSHVNLQSIPSSFWTNTKPTKTRTIVPRYSCIYTATSAAEKSSEGDVSEENGDGLGVRTTSQVPASLRDTLKILWEEELYIPGLELLNNLFAQGGSSTGNKKSERGEDKAGTGSELMPIFIPPPVYLQIMTTLLAHPSFTTHMRKKGETNQEAQWISRYAEIILQRGIALAGTIGVELGDAWKFSTAGERRERSMQHLPGNSGDSGVFEDDKLDLKIATEKGMFERAGDFWAILGWGFTCACAEGEHAETRKWMRRRWDNAWKRVLRVMIEGLERDWVERAEIDAELVGESKENVDEEGMNLMGGRGGNGALILKLLPDAKAGSAGWRRVIRAILATGKGRMAGEFKEIWMGETEDARSKAKELVNINWNSNGKGGKGGKKMRRMVEEDENNEKLDRGMFDESSSEDEGSGEEFQESNEGTEDMIELKMEEEGSSRLPPNTADLWGGVEAIMLRRRIIMLISHLCSLGLYIPLEWFYEELRDYLLMLPLPEFELFTSNAYMPETILSPKLAMHLSLNMNLFVLDGILSSDAPMPDQDMFKSGITEEGFGLSMHELAKCYLGFAARTARGRDNAKVAMLLDGLVRGIVRMGGEGSEETDWTMVWNKVREGEEKRRAKVEKRVMKRGEDGEIVKKVWMGAEDRLRMVVGTLAGCL
ncbi:hypothetical protein BDZ91DRAFT_736065 [Kalaharituber pfeilii]|nr:hypothetical protein BDZ91DRAFT_736065 [Kalaharituber pfeilii]